MPSVPNNPVHRVVNKTVLPVVQRAAEWEAKKVLRPLIYLNRAQKVRCAVSSGC